MDPNANLFDHASTISLIPCSQYKSIASQPFQVYIALEALLILNVHSHLSKNEVIGFLGGFCFESKTNQNQKYILIHQAYPCNSTIQNMKERQKNVELCPESAEKARHLISQNGQKIVGWYHSHPFFKVEPSNIDIRNHATYQSNFDKDNLPFVALITGPYSDKSK